MIKKILFLFTFLILIGCTTNIPDSSFEDSVKIPENRGIIESEPHKGTYGTVVSGNYTAELDFCETLEEAQSIIDLENRAVFINRGGEGFIADHNTQGASEILKNVKLTLILPDNSKIQYTKINEIYTDKPSWLAEDKDMYYYNQDKLMFQTCYNEGFVFVLYEKCENFSN